MGSTVDNGTPAILSNRTNVTAYKSDTINATRTSTNDEIYGASIDFEWLQEVDDIRSKLTWALSLHAIIFGCLFFLIAFYTFFSILNIRSQISKKRFMSGINTFLCISSFSRALSLLIDCYGSLKILPNSSASLLWAIGFPCLTSSFCLLQLAFLHIAKLKFGWRILREEIFLRTMITLHIFSTTLRVFIWTVNRSTGFVLTNYLCEFVSLCWTLFVYVSFLYIGYEVFKLLHRLPSTMLKSSGYGNEGLMQLEVLASASNLVTSVTAALVPTLLGPAANLASNKSSKLGQNVIVSGSEKNERSDVSSSSMTTNAPSLKLSSSERKQKSITEPKMVAVMSEGPTRKKLTWQPSITNERQSEPVGSKALPNSIITKRPILKDSNKAEFSSKLETNNAIDVQENVPQIKVNTDVITETSDTSSKENDILLRTILHHIAYVNRASGSSDYMLAARDHELTRLSPKKQVRFVLRITYFIAILGFCLTIAEFFQRFGPYGLIKYFLKNRVIQPWPWFVFQTFCRSCEVIMSIVIANITKQSVSSIHHYQKHNPAIIKQRGSMFM